MDTQNNNYNKVLHTRERVLEITEEKINTNNTSQMETESKQEEKKKPIKNLKKKRKVCSAFDCKKKLGLTGFPCRCSDTHLFCSEHRFDHNCTFDYRTHARENLIKENPLVITSKLQDKI